MVASTATHKFLGAQRGRGLRLLRLFGAASGLATLACGGDTAGPSSALTPAQAYWSLQFNQHAVTLALTTPYDTIRLTATPRNVLGQPLSGLGTARFQTSDSTIAIDATGLVTARFATSTQPAVVVASLTDTAQHVTLVDTCFVQVTATAAPLASFRLQVAQPANVGSPVLYSFSATDDVGNPVPVLAYFMSSDSTILGVGSRNIFQASPMRTGTVTVYAATWAYGVAMRDSVSFTVGFPRSATIQALPVTPTGTTHVLLKFWPQTIQVSPGAIISWTNASYTDSMDVIFDDTTNVDSIRFKNLVRYRFGTGTGNIAPWVLDTTGTDTITAKICRRSGGLPPNCGFLLDFSLLGIRQRLFPVAGTYHYHSAKWGSSGTIVVQ